MQWWDDKEYIIENERIGIIDKKIQLLFHCVYVKSSYLTVTTSHREVYLHIDYSYIIIGVNERPE